MRLAIDGVVGEIDTMPGCTQVAISHAVFVRPSERGKGRGKKAHQARIRHLQNLGYNYVLCTVDAANVAQVKILVSSGWKLLDTFVSDKTQHSVHIYGRNL